ncbi:hypothetical protein [Runella slithyformis]|uniref:Tetrahydromethanopterin S-methyltransferase n=1 Tax=Runella slithyformis (strain ATCC 29530 / DSM 19594 / LMG 11500 / NCIMB 11436 / LSU 4) TaxID=761193 RepID=A0A7U4E4Q5_RUNSL|nr:hypothetical protein [Runella slithyformis]AEI47673.1 hypothetical protein Runsl_1246 [Runella slithyformis DSM 19594]
MDLVKVLENIDRISKDGVPFNVSVETQTLRTSGAYIIGGLALCGFITGIIVAIAILISKK